MDGVERANGSSFKSLTGQDVRVKVVDVGANPIDGAPPYRGLLHEGMADVVGFEPNPEALARLEAQKGPNETYLPHAVGDGARHTLHFCAAQGMTSLYRPNQALLRHFHGFPLWGAVVAKAEIETVRLDDIAETADLDLLKMDIQGAELMVLRHARERLGHALVIQTEVEFLPLYEEQPLFSDVEQFLRGQGFLFHRFFPIVSRAIQPMVVNNDLYAGLSQQVWADAIFVRDFTRLERLGERQLLAMAAILHDCYRSYDLALHAVLEHDRRSGGSLAQTYLGALQAAAA